MGKVNKNIVIAAFVFVLSTVSSALMVQPASAATSLGGGNIKNKSTSAYSIKIRCNSSSTWYYLLPGQNSIATCGLRGIMNTTYFALASSTHKGKVDYYLSNAYLKSWTVTDTGWKAMNGYPFGYEIYVTRK